MATVNFSVPEEVKQQFNRAFAGENKSSVVARLMMQAVEERRAQRLLKWPGPAWALATKFPVRLLPDAGIFGREAVPGEQPLENIPVITRRFALTQPVDVSGGQQHGNRPQNKGKEEAGFHD